MTELQEQNRPHGIRATRSMTRFPIRTVDSTLIRGGLRDVGLPGGLLDPLARTPGILLAHGDGEVGVTEQRGGLFPEPRPDAGHLLKAEDEADIEAAPHRQ